MLVVAPKFWWPEVQVIPLLKARKDDYHVTKSSIPIILPYLIEEHIEAMDNFCIMLATVVQEIAASI